MRFKEASVAGEFANWTRMFEPSTFHRNAIVPQVRCSKCELYVDENSIDEHLVEYHKHDIGDGIVVQVNDQWWRRRGVKSET
jgi:hypothetical protein